MEVKPDYQTKIYQAGGYIYICKANPGVDNTLNKQVWQIARFDSDGSKSYANFTPEFNKVAENYASYTY